MTRGWELCVQWKDGSTNWVSLKDVKNSFPIELADYAIDVICKQKSLLQKVKSKYWQRTHKYEVKIPKSAEEAHCIDKENGNLMWANAIK